MASSHPQRLEKNAQQTHSQAKGARGNKDKLPWLGAEAIERAWLLSGLLDGRFLRLLSGGLHWRLTRRVLRSGLREKVDGSCKKMARHKKRPYETVICELSRNTRPYLLLADHSSVR